VGQQNYRIKRAGKWGGGGSEAGKLWTLRRKSFGRLKLILLGRRPRHAFFKFHPRATNVISGARLLVSLFPGREKLRPGVGGPERSGARQGSWSWESSGHALSSFDLAFISRN
jgi:hypothetical protein